MIHIEQAPPNFDTEAGLEAFREGRLHVVCSACNGLSCLNVMAHQGTPDEQFDKELTAFCDQVNQRGEPGTLYPRLNLSVFSGWNSEPWVHPACDDEDRVLEQVVRVIRINEETVRKDTMFLYDDQGCFTGRAFLAALSKLNAWEAEHGEFAVTKRLLHY